MTPPADGWDRDEQEVLRDLEREFQVLRERHQADPPIELLRAARGEVLPDELQDAVSRHLAESAWSRALVDGVASGEGVFDSQDQARLLDRVLKRATDLPRRRSLWNRLPRLEFVAAAACLILVVALFAWRTLASRTEESRQTPPAVAAAASSPAPTFHLKLEAPTMRLSTAVLTWRGPAQGNRLLTDLEPGLAAFKSGDYERANAELSRLVETYPNAFDVRYYQGISRLLVNDINGAVDSLTAAERMADATFAPDVAWYLAVAGERAGKSDEVRTRLTRLCQAGVTHAADACKALEQIR